MCIMPMTQKVMQNQILALEEDFYVRWLSLFTNTGTKHSVSNRNMQTSNRISVTYVSIRVLLR
jgi:hypothetical protein